VATFTRNPKIIQRWSGTTTDVARIAREAHRLLTEALSSSSDQISFRIDVGQPGREDSYTTVEEFEAGVSDLDAIHKITIHVASRGYPGRARVLISIWKPHGAEVKVTGTDQTLVSGLATALHEMLVKGRIRGASLLSLMPAVYGPAAAIAGSALYNLVDHRRHNTSDWIIFAVAALLVFLALIGGFLSWAIPTGEVRLPDTPTRLRRTAGSVLGKLALFLITAVTTSVIAALIAKAI
jgi:hypothetical protein